MQDSKNTARFYFHGSLQDFLRKRDKGSWLTYTFFGTPAVKDALEAIGVPHPEVDVLLVNNKPAPLLQPLRPKDEVQAFPVSADKNWPPGYSFATLHPAPTRFVLDVHLGTLAKRLRLLGLDALYQTDLDGQTIAALAEEQQRVVLTRDVGLLKQKRVTWGYWLRSQHTEEQVEEVVRRFSLWDAFAPFSRCLECNALLEPVEKQQVLAELPPKTKVYFNAFYRCRACGRVYWKGSHYERMQEYVAQLRAKANS